MSCKTSKRKAVLIVLVVFMLILAGCSSKYQTKPDYAITEQVTMNFITAYTKGDIDKALENVAENCVLTTDSGELKGKNAVAELIKMNVQKNNTMEIAETSKIDESKIMLIVNNKIPLFQLAGINNIKTREKFEVQDSKIVKYEVKYLKESVDYIAEMASGSTGMTIEVTNDQMIVQNVQKKSPAEYKGIKKGDILLSIDGVTFKDMKYGSEEIPYRLIGQAGSRVDLDLSRGTEQLSVKLTRVNEADFK